MQRTAARSSACCAQRIVCLNKVNGKSALHGERSYASVKAALQRLKQLRCGIPSGWSLVSRKGRKEREDSSADEVRKDSACLCVETHAQRAYFAAFVQFAKQEDVNLHMKNLASFASLREIKASTPDGSKGEATCKFCEFCAFCVRLKAFTRQATVDRRLLLSPRLYFAFLVRLYVALVLIRIDILSSDDHSCIVAIAKVGIKGGTEGLHRG